MWSTVLRQIWARKRRLIGTGLAIVLGVAFLTATLTVSDTMRAGFEEAFTTANSGTDVVVRSAESVRSSDGLTRGLIGADVGEQISSVDGVAAVVPSVVGTGTILDPAGQRIGGDGPPTVATNWVDVPGIGAWELAEGRAPADRPGDVHEVVVDRGSAKAAGFALGDTATVLTPDPVEVEIVGIATFAGADSLGPTTYTAFTFNDAQALLMPDAETVSGFSIVADDDVSSADLRRRIAAQVPTGVEVLTGAQRTVEQQDEIGDDFLDFFGIVLLAFAGIAVVAATFTIHNTLSILVAQRTRESALLRAIGASRRQILAGVTLESVAVGVVATVLGFGAGLGLAVGLDALMSSAGLDLPGSGLSIQLDTVVIATIVGVGTTLLASLAPAIRASRVAPLAALRDVAVDRSATSVARAVAGGVITAGSFATIVGASSVSDQPLGWTALGALGLLVGTIVLGPTVARPASAVIGSVAAARGVSGRLARRNAMRNPRRVAGAATALLVGTAVVGLFTTFGASITASIDQTVDENFAGDLVVLPDDFSGAGLSPQLATSVADLPEVERAVPLAFAAVSLDGVEVEPTATDPQGLATVLDVHASTGSLADVGPGEVAISSQWADERGLELGDTLTMAFVDGAEQTVSVALVYEERMTVGDVVMPLADWRPHTQQAADRVLLIDLADGVVLGVGQQAVTAVTEQFAAPAPMDRDEYIESIAGQIDEMLFVVYALLGIAVLIALIGIGNTLALSIHERTRELGILRAVGQTRSQVRTTVRWEAIIVAVFGTVGGLAVGTFLGWGLMRAMAVEEGFGVFAAPITPLVVVLVLAAVAGVVAAIRPARRAARLDILQAIATD